VRLQQRGNVLYSSCMLQKGIICDCLHCFCDAMVLHAAKGAQHQNVHCRKAGTVALWQLSWARRLAKRNLGTLTIPSASCTEPGRQESLGASAHECAVSSNMTDNPWYPHCFCHVLHDWCHQCFCAVLYDGPHHVHHSVLLKPLILVPRVSGFLTSAHWQDIPIHREFSEREQSP